MFKLCGCVPTRLLSLFFYSLRGPDPFWSACALGKSYENNSFFFVFICRDSEINFYTLVVWYVSLNFCDYDLDSRLFLDLFRLVQKQITTFLLLEYSENCSSLFQELQDCYHVWWVFAIGLVCSLGLGARVKRCVALSMLVMFFFGLKDSGYNWQDPDGTSADINSRFCQYNYHVVMWSAPIQLAPGLEIALLLMLCLP